jgi:hypothetical protein
MLNSFLDQASAPDHAPALSRREPDLDPEGPSFPATITELGVTLAGISAVMLAICSAAALFE